MPRPFHWAPTLFCTRLKDWEAQGLIQQISTDGSWEDLLRRRAELRRDSMQKNSSCVGSSTSGSMIVSGSLGKWRMTCRFSLIELMRPLHMKFTLIQASVRPNSISFNTWAMVWQAFSFLYSAIPFLQSSAAVYIEFCNILYFPLIIARDIQHRSTRLIESTRGGSNCTT